jgi:hypothetical protein
MPTLRTQRCCSSSARTNQARLVAALQPRYDFVVRQTRGHAGQRDRQRTRDLRPRRRNQLLAPDRHGEDGQNTMSVVNGALEVYGVEKPRIADGSIMPRITTGTPWPACVIIGERAAEFVTEEHRL